MTAARTDQLTMALINAASQGLRPHCSDPTTHRLWLSEHESERQVAVMLCRHCPVLTVCRDTAEQRDERFGVWGGRDFSRRPGRAKDDLIRR
jgi:Transcription factor WhiB